MFSGDVSKAGWNSAASGGAGWMVWTLYGGVKA